MKRYGSSSASQCLIFPHCKGRSYEELSWENFVRIHLAVLPQSCLHGFTKLYGLNLPKLQLSNLPTHAS